MSFCCPAWRPQTSSRPGWKPLAIFILTAGPSLGWTAGAKSQSRGSIGFSGTSGKWSDSQSSWKPPLWWKYEIYLRNLQNLRETETPGGSTGRRWKDAAVFCKRRPFARCDRSSGCDQRSTVLAWRLMSPMSAADLLSHAMSYSLRWG